MCVHIVKKVYVEFGEADFGAPLMGQSIWHEWFENGAADGFHIMLPYLPRGLDDFVDLVIPEFQKRGLFRLEYAGNTVRENLGAKRPSIMREIA